ncbi:DUF6603 domain-containing protein [Nonomuraea guangzhouensis]|uniref:DUF6603 domain-containing protein n=1 Tax=Nonomuraea guangzhouensis TaxID=1291555 RepID=A0ABW4GTU9_9ACTN|nr:DUF6603 domain-containing protein [Nonomuraea guangzhouensis]
MDLQRLKQYLDGLTDPIALTAADTELPTELRDFLGTTPNQRILVSPGIDGVTLQGSTLTIAGKSGELWPVAGIAGLQTTVDDIVVTLVDGAVPSVSATATGTAQLKHAVSAPVTLVSHREGDTGGWRLTLAADETGLSPNELLMLHDPSGNSPFAIPPDLLDPMTKAAKVLAGGLDILFYPGKDLETYLTFAVELPSVRWPIIPSVLELNGIGVRAQTSGVSFSMLLLGHVGVGDTPMDVGIGMQPGAHWYASLTPAGDTAFPGLAELAAWACPDITSDVTSAFGSIGLSSEYFDAAIKAVEAGFDIELYALDYLHVDSLLSIAGLEFDVVAQFPAFEVHGSYEGSAALTEVLREFDLPTEGIPKELTISAARFSAQPADGSYLVGFVVDGVWRLGPMELTELGVTVSYSAAGGAEATIGGEVRLGDSIALSLLAEYDSAGGWTFEGSTLPGSALDVGDLVKALEDLFKADKIPMALDTLALHDLKLSYQTTSGKFAFTCAGDMTISEVPLRLVTDIEVVPHGAAYTTTFDGRLEVAVPVDGDVLDLRLGAHFAEDPAAKRFTATYSHADPDPVPGVQSLVAAFSPQAAQYVPEGVTVDIDDATFALDETTGDGAAPVTAYLFGVEIDAAVDLRHLPLVGDHFTGETLMGVSPLRITAASAPMTAAQVKALNAMLLKPNSPTEPEPISPMPERDTAAGFAIDGELRLGPLRQPLALPVADTATPSAAATTDAEPAVSAPDPAQAQTGDNVKWVKIHRGVGPVQIERVGLAYRQGDDPRLAVLLDAAITAAGLTLSLDGLEAGLPMSDPAAEPSFDLAGLGLSYTSGPVRIDGAFLKGEIQYKGTTCLSYGGGAQIKTEEFGLAAIGSYAQLPDHVAKGPSLFVYAYLDQPIGGPPFFFVRGLAAGFGYNRKLLPPPLDAIATFPLVAEAVGAPPAATLADELKQLADHLPPSLGDSFLTVGIHFTSFQMIDSFVLVTAAFGRRFEVDLLGLSTLVLPAPVPGTAPAAGKTPIAEVQLALRATFVPDDGYLSASAQLTRNSFLLSRDCHLAGGFAFSTWFAGEHDGDFVLTAGGYHPHFPVPTHYPVVPRLSFSWQVTKQFALSGTAYYALTPAALMAGGSLNATYHDGSLHAWFDASMDFLIGWQPYHYEASIHVGVGVTYTYSFFGKHTVNAHVGTDVHIWGPDFAGTATIHLSVVTFTISFGSGKKSKPAALSWDQFRAAMLPGEIVTLSLRSDTRQTSGDSAGTGANLGVADPAGLVIVTDSVIPSTKGLSGPQGEPLATDEAATGFGVGPTGHGAGTVTTTHNITITRDGGPVDGQFVYTPIRKNLPFALWGTKITPSTGDPSLVPGLLTGYEIRPHAAAEPADPPSLNRTELQAAGSLSDVRDAIDLVTPPPFTPASGSADQRAEAINGSIADAQVSAARAAVAEALAGGAEIDLRAFRTSHFHEIPQVAEYV